MYFEYKCIYDVPISARLFKLYLDWYADVTLRSVLDRALPTELMARNDLSGAGQRT